MKHIVFLSISLIVAVFLSGASRAQTPETGASAVMPTEYIYIDSEGVSRPQSAANYIYRVLVSEVALNEGEYDLAGQGLLELAQDTQDPRFAERAFKLAMIEQDVSLGLESARLWSQLDPDNPEARASALALEASTGETEGMAETLRQRIELAHNKEQAVVQAMGIVSRMVDPFLALEVFESALPNDVRGLMVTHMALADLAWEAQQPERAAQEARAALRLAPESEAAAVRVLEYGLVYTPDEALAQAKAYARTYPQARQLQLMLVNRLVEYGQPDEALRLLKSMQQHNPEDFDLLFIEAEVYRQTKQFTKAKRRLNEYIEVQKQRRRTVNDAVSTALSRISDARLALVQIAEAELDYAEAIRQLALIEEPSLAFQARVHRAVLEARMGAMEQAQQTLDTAGARTTQDEVVVELTRASIYREAEQLEQAITVLERADRQMPDTPEIKYDLGMLYVLVEDYRKFERTMRQVIDLAPDHANAYNALGYTFADQNRNLNEAQDLLEQAFELDPNNPYILDSIGWYLYRIGDLEAAYEYLLRSFELLPLADVGAHLGEVLWVKGRHNEALEIWQMVYEEEPENPTLQDALERFGVTL